eukprot:4961562-Amphidinium_carterae.1
MRNANCIIMRSSFPLSSGSANHFCHYSMTAPKAIKTSQRLKANSFNRQQSKHVHALQEDVSSDSKRARP